MLDIKYDGKFQVTYTTSDGVDSAFRVMTEMGEAIAQIPDMRRMKTTSIWWRTLKQPLHLFGVLTSRRIRRSLPA